MRSSDLHNARWHLDALVSALDPLKLKDTIDTPLEVAAESFPHIVSCPGSSKEFNSIISDFVGHVYQSASQGKRCLSREESLTIGISALDDIYGRHGRKGYEHALVDVLTDGHTEMGDILGGIVMWIKHSETEAHARWVYAQHVESLTWPTKCALVEVIRQAYLEETGVALFTGDPASRAGELTEFVAAYVETDPDKLAANQAPSSEILDALLPLF